MPNTETIIIPGTANQIKIENYVIGYKEQGESIVVIFKYDNEVFYSLVIDSYETNINETTKILNDNNIHSIDVLVWTHPHRDHSMGIINLLNTFCNQNTKVVIPNIDETLKEDIPSNCREIYDEFSKINLHNKRSNGELIYGMSNLPLYNSYINWHGEQLNFNLYCMSPITKFLSNNKFTGTTNINDYSLAIFLEFNNIVFIYGGDIESKTINGLIKNNYNIENIAFLKAPHHGSNSTKSIFHLLNITQNTICAVTNYNNGDIHLPNSEMIDEYSNKTKELYLFNSKDEIIECGILKSEFIMNDSRNILFENHLHGLVYHYEV